MKTHCSEHSSFETDCLECSDVLERNRNVYKEAEAKLRQANSLIFAVEKMFKDDPDEKDFDDLLQRWGYAARCETGKMQHELLIREGIRSR